MSCAEIEGARATWTSHRAYREPAHNRCPVIFYVGLITAPLLTIKLQLTQDGLADYLLWVYRNLLILWCPGPESNRRPAA